MCSALSHIVFILPSLSPGSISRIKTYSEACSDEFGPRRPSLNRSLQPNPHSQGPDLPAAMFTRTLLHGFPPHQHPTHSRFCIGGDPPKLPSSDNHFRYILPLTLFQIAAIVAMAVFTIPGALGFLLNEPMGAHIKSL